MKNSILPVFFAVILVSCGGKIEKDTSGLKSTLEQDTLASVDPAKQNEIKQDQKTMYFEDYARYKTKKQLKAAFESDQLKDGSSWYAEGTVEIKHTILTDPDHGHIVKFLWDDDGETLESIEAHYMLYDEDYNVVNAQKITSKCGLYTGMSLKDLDEWNQDTITFAGFGWDYAGNVFNRTAGKLNDCRTQIRLALDGYKGYDFEATSKYLGDIELHSKMEGILEAPIVINEMTYNISD